VLASCWGTYITHTIIRTWRCHLAVIDQPKLRETKSRLSSYDCMHVCVASWRAHTTERSCKPMNEAASCVLATPIATS
jgi:hypothetical protein